MAERALERLAEPLSALFLPADRWPQRRSSTWPGCEVIRNARPRLDLRLLRSTRWCDAVLPPLRRGPPHRRRAGRPGPRALRRVAGRRRRRGRQPLGPHPGRGGRAGPARVGNGRRPAAAGRDPRRGGPPRDRRRRRGAGGRAGDLPAPRADRAGADRRRRSGRGPPAGGRAADGRPAGEHDRRAERAVRARPLRTPSAWSGSSARDRPGGPCWPGSTRSPATAGSSGTPPVPAGRPPSPSTGRRLANGLVTVTVDPADGTFAHRRPRRARPPRRRRRRRRHLQLVTPGPRTCSWAGRPRWR